MVAAARIELEHCHFFLLLKIVTITKVKTMKKLNSILQIAVGLLLIVLITSCEKAYLEPEKSPVDVSYANDMQPFFNAKCISCHNGSGIPLNLLENVSYDNLMNGGYIDTNTPKNSKLYVKLLPGESMEQYANSAERTMTLSWIEQGAKNN
jgi:hypothetical protein